MNYKVIVCGASGLLGRELCKKLYENNIKYIGTYCNNPQTNLIKIDFLNINDIEDKFNELEPTICINCIVERQVEICENNWELIKKTNIDIPNNIAKICNKLNIFLIHISTDYVFDGSNPPYYPESQTNPLQNYGISKLISENKIIAKCSNFAIIRVPVLFSDNIKNFEENAVTIIGTKVLNRIEIFKEDNYSIRRPNFIYDFCNFIIDLIKNPIKGIYHYCNPYDKVTKYEVSNIISNYLNIKNNIIPINNEPNDGIERPKDTLLLDKKYNIYSYTFTPLKLALEKCFSKIWHPKTNYNDIFLMIDMDGTITNTELIHYNGYKYALEQYGINIDFDEYINLSNNGKINDFLKEKIPEDYNNVKIIKNSHVKNNENIKLMNGAEEFINFINKFNINHVVVTNTSKENVDFFKEKQPLLNNLKNWITKEDYNKPKPDSECYITGKTKFYNNEKYIIGIENTICGYKSIKNITNIIYLMTSLNDSQYKYFKSLDVYLINNLTNILE